MVFSARYIRIWFLSRAFSQSFFLICFYQRPLTLYKKRFRHYATYQRPSSKRFRHFSLNFLLFCLLLEKKLASNLMRILWGVFWYGKVDEILIKVSFCILRILHVFELRAGRRLGPFSACLLIKKLFFHKEKGTRSEMRLEYDGV